MVYEKGMKDIDYRVLFLVSLVLAWIGGRGRGHVVPVQRVEEIQSDQYYA